jgi:tRNA (guanine37-N1)-methyltransferase|tara:strand:- start:1280 stop:1975 length:696 start_codon:yes stop_codon:yes gene_type:complete
MIFKILTLFPEIFPGPLNHSITGRALVEKKFEIEAINIREFSKNKSKTVDDKPYGGGPGMIFKPDILQRSLNFAKKKARKKTKIIMLSANGRKFDQKFAKETIKNDELIIICGRYEGVDQRFIDFNSIEEISIGDYVLSGGEIPALILIDTCVRLIPEVLGNNKSLNSESFNNHLLEYPQYTKPLNWKELKVPDVLLSGDHKKIFDWRLKKSIEKTKKVRPDLLKLYFEKK